MTFKLKSSYQPRGDQPAAIEQLLHGVEAGDKHQVLLGVTGSGKTFAMAKVIESSNRPALVLAHNKTLAAQLYHEFKSFFPENAVEYFVSYYDFYQPEAYVPATDVYIEKESTINDELDKLRMSATRSLFERRDVIIVASVSCIYGLGSPEAYYGMLVMLEKGHHTTREALLRRFVDIQYERSEDLRRGTFRVRGDILEIYPTYEDQAYRIEMFGDQIDMLRQIDPLTGEVRPGHQNLSRVPIYPKTHYVMPQSQRERAIVTATPGTTRDLVSETVAIGGIPVRLVDTAGIRRALDEAESIGIRKSMEALAEADLVLAVIDCSQPVASEDRELLSQIGKRPAILVANKCDLNGSQFPVADAGLPQVRTSAVTGEGVHELRAQILQHIGTGAETESGMLTNIRHRNLVRDSLAALDAARIAVKNRVPHEMLLLDLYNALRPLDEITGATTTDNILNLIFSKFCIGK